MTKLNCISGEKNRSTLSGNKITIRNSFILGISMLSLIALSPVADAGCACSSGVWDPSSFLNSGLETSQTAQNDSVAQKTSDRSDSFPNGEILKAMKGVSSSDTVLDVSNGESYALSHINDAIHIPTKDFLDSEGNLRTSGELAEVLGSAGISRDDSVVVYGTSESSGEAEFAFLVLSYLGQEDVKLLDGNLADWKAAGLPVAASDDERPVVEYTPEVNSEVIAKYEYVKSGQARIVDVRPFVEFGQGRIPGSTALDPTNIIKGDKIKDVGDLSTVFDRLSKETPIVVYSDDYSQASLVWYALQLMGYEARIYTWDDWKAHESTGAKGDTVISSEDIVSSKYVKLGKT